LRYHGAHALIGESAYQLCKEWLPASGEVVRDHPLFFQYLDIGQDKPEHERITDVFLPLK
jgi:AraC family transcriptional regulator